MGELTVPLNNQGLMVAAPGDMIPDGFFTNLYNMTSNKQGYIENRQGITSVGDTGSASSVHSQGRMIIGGSAYTYQGSGTALYRAFSSIATGFSGNPFTFRDLTFELSTNSYIGAFDSTKRVKDSGSAVTNFGIAGPTAVASAVAATALTKTIDTFEYATNGAIQGAYATASATITTTSTAPAVGTYAGNLAVAASTVGTATASEATIPSLFPLDLSQFATPGDSDDDDFIVFWLKIDVPSYLVEIRIEFDVDPSTNDFQHNYYWKSIQASQITPAVDSSVTADTIRQSIITNAAFEDPETLADIDQRVNQLLSEYLDAGLNQWGQFFVKKGDFTRVGSSSNDWGDVNAIRIQVETNSDGPVNVGIDSIYMQGGTAYKLNGDYDWIYQYENSTTGTRSPFYDAMAAQVTIDKTKATVTVQNPTDTQASHIRLYRRGGDFPDDYLLSVRQAVSTWSGNLNITDGVADADLGEVADFGTGSDLIELSNAATTEIEPTIMEMHQERCWVNDTNYPDRLWYSDRGNSEMFREDAFILSKSGPGDPILRPFTLDDQMFLFTAKTVKRVVGSGPESFEALNTGAELGLFSLNAICRGEGKIFYRTYDGIYMMSGSGYPVKITTDIDPIFHGQLLSTDDANIVAIDSAYASTERMEYFDSLLHFSYTGTNGTRYELIRDFETNRWEQTSIGATSYLRLDDDGLLYVGGSDGLVYQDQSSQQDIGIDIPIDFRTRYIDLGAPDREKFITSIVVDADLGGGSITAYLDLNNGDDVVSQSITNSSRGTIQFPMTEEVRCRNFAFRVTGDNGGVRMRFYKVTFYYEIAPPMTRRIDSYELDFDWTRWKFIRRLWVSGRSDGEVTLTVYANGTSVHTDTFSMAVVNQGWAKTELKFPAGLKATLFRFIFTSDNEFQIFLDQSDCEWHPLNSDRGYQRARLVRQTS